MLAVLNPSACLDLLCTFARCPTMPHVPRPACASALAQEHCQRRLGDSTSSLRLFAFDEIQRLNAAGGCWLVLDGMVLDVTRWLPQHPGGSKIIPRQSLNLDCR